MVVWLSVQMYPHSKNFPNVCCFCSQLVSRLYLSSTHENSLWPQVVNNAASQNSSPLSHRAGSPGFIFSILQQQKRLAGETETEDAFTVEHLSHKLTSSHENNWFWSRGQVVKFPNGETCWSVTFRGTGWKLPQDGARLSTFCYTRSKSWHNMWGWHHTRVLFI